MKCKVLFISCLWCHFQQACNKTYFNIAHSSSNSFNMLWLLPPCCLPYMTIMQYRCRIVRVPEPESNVILIQSRFLYCITCLLSWVSRCYQIQSTDLHKSRKGCVKLIGNEVRWPTRVRGHSETLMIALGSPVASGPPNWISESSHIAFDHNYHYITFLTNLRCLLCRDYRAKGALAMCSRKP